MANRVFASEQRRTASSLKSARVASGKEKRAPPLCGRYPVADIVRARMQYAGDKAGSFTLPRNNQFNRFRLNHGVAPDPKSRTQNESGISYQTDSLFSCRNLKRMQLFRAASSSPSPARASVVRDADSQALSGGGIFPVGPPNVGESPDSWCYVPEVSCRDAGPSPGHPPPQTQEGRRPGIGRRPGEGRAAARVAAAPREGARPERPPRTGKGPGREGRPAPRGRRGAGRPAPRAARASRRPSWSPAARRAAPAGAARSRRSARRCRSRR